jgi:hypothetical protein
MGHYCRLCGRVRANERFSGRGHRDHVCKDCERMPREKRDRMERLDEIVGFLHQSNISARNLARLGQLCSHARPEIVELAALVLEIGRVLPAKRNRWLKLARRHSALFGRAVGLLGLEFFEDLLAGYGDFDSPLWDILEEHRIAPPWTARPCDCGSGRAFRDCCLERDNAQADELVSSEDSSFQSSLSDQRLPFPTCAGRRDNNKCCGRPVPGA